MDNTYDGNTGNKLLENKVPIVKHNFNPIAKKKKCCLMLSQLMSSASYSTATLKITFTKDQVIINQKVFTIGGFYSTLFQNKT